MLTLPWFRAPENLAAGVVVRIGRDDYEVAEEVRAGDVLGLGSDGRLYRVTPVNARRTRT